MRLSPLDPLKFNLFHGIGAAHFGKAEYAEAAQWVEKCLREKPDAVWANRLLTAAYYHAGEIEEAKRAFAAFLVHFPKMTISRVLELTPVSSQQVHGKFAEAFMNLGLPE
jgi:adenylate cyclase